MKAKKILMSGAVAFGMAAMGSFAAESASAQSVLRGRFHLDHRVQWDEAKLEPGDYTIQLDSTVHPARALVGSADGKRRLIIMAMSKGDAPSGQSCLLLERKSGQWVVLALNLPGAGVSLRFASPRLAVREDPRAASVPVASAK